MKVNLYIASSIKTLKRQNGVVGFVIEADMEGKPTFTQFGVVKDATENQAQLLAFKFALKHIKEGNEIEVYTDNAYLEAAFSQGWLKGWIDRDWKTAKGKEVANKEEWLSVVEGLHGTIPSFQVSKPHEYRQWLATETERRAKKYV